MSEYKRLDHFVGKLDSNSTTGLGTYTVKYPTLPTVSILKYIQSKGPYIPIQTEHKSSWQVTLRIQIANGDWFMASCPRLTEFTLSTLFHFLANYMTINPYFITIVHNNTCYQLINEQNKYRTIGDIVRPWGKTHFWVIGNVPFEHTGVIRLPLLGNVSKVLH
jgi:hypothetical protein